MDFKCLMSHLLLRYITYCLVHSGVEHILFNLLMQLFVGVPLEMSHQGCRVGLVYLMGVLAGSLGTSIFDPRMYLAGASGGVYSLITAHLATLILNWKEDSLILRHRIREGKVILWLPCPDVQKSVSQPDRAARQADTQKVRHNNSQTVRKAGQLKSPF